MDNYYLLERLAAEKRNQIVDEVRRDRIGMELVRASRPYGMTFWQRLASLSPTTWRSPRRSPALTTDGVNLVESGETLVATS